MQKTAFEAYLHEKIPLTSAMGITIATFSPDVVEVCAPLAPNINHKGTFFGGSIHTVMTVCGWSMMFANIHPVDETAHIVIGKSEIQYLQPITGDMTATCTVDTDARDAFLARYHKRGKARLKLTVRCQAQGVDLAVFEGQFIAFRDAP